MNDEREFAQALFDNLVPMAHALVDAAQLAAGREFKPADVQWLEATPDGSATQWCRLMWRDTTLLELQMSIHTLKAEVRVDWVRPPH